jgi:hypothetical protein
MAKRKIKSITGGGMSYREEKGYSRVGGAFKSKELKTDLEAKAKRANAFSADQNKQVADTMQRNNDVPGALKKGAILNSGGGEPGYQGDQRYKKTKRTRLARFRGGDDK